MTVVEVLHSALAEHRAAPMTAHDTISSPARPLSRRSRVTVTLIATLLLPLSAYAALGATVATVMAVASGGEYNVAGFVLVAAGLLLMVTPVVVLLALMVMWVASLRGSQRLARRVAWVPLPLLAVTLGMFALVLTI